MVPSSEFHEGLARLGLHVRRIHDRQSAKCQSLGRDEVQHLKGVTGHGLIVVVVTEQPSKRIRREDFRRQEVLPGEGAFTGAAHADQHNKAQFWNRDLHFDNFFNPSLGPPTGEIPHPHRDGVPLRATQARRADSSAAEPHENGIVDKESTRS